MYLYIGVFLAIVAIGAFFAMKSKSSNKSNSTQTVNPDDKMKTEENKAH